MKIGIVGGSIAGCSAAVLLLKDGHEVTVFERSKKALVGRGGGIGTLPSVIQQIKEEGMLDDDFPYFEVSKLPFVGKSSSSEPYGHTAWAVPIQFYVFQWNALWYSLRNNVPDTCYRAGVEILDAGMNLENKVVLTTAEGQQEQFDLVLFADGYKSLGRRLMFSDAELEYRGYILWRGLLPESEITGAGPLTDAILRLSYVDEPGHNVMYYIPNQDGSVQEGDRVFNWAAYIAVPEDELDDLMTDKRGKVWKGTLPPGAITVENEQKLKKFLMRNTPSYYANIVNKTPDTYIQVIYTLDLPAYFKNRTCLIGDAGMVIQPFTGSGVFKGYNNAKDLITAIHEAPSLDGALKIWSDRQLQEGRRLLALGLQMEKAFIWEQPDFALLDETATQDW